MPARDFIGSPKVRFRKGAKALLAGRIQSAADSLLQYASHARAAVADVVVCVAEDIQVICDRNGYVYTRADDIAVGVT
jgi:hypothetical protein